MDLSSQLDPVALATSSVELNLRLMKWRLMPALDTERVAATSCLLLGAGTVLSVAQAEMRSGRPLPSARQRRLEAERHAKAEEEKRTKIIGLDLLEKDKKPK